MTLQMPCCSGHILQWPVLPLQAVQVVLCYRPHESPTWSNHLSVWQCLFMGRKLSLLHSYISTCWLSCSSVWVQRAHSSNCDLRRFAAWHVSQERTMCWCHIGQAPVPPMVHAVLLFHRVLLCHLISIRITRCVRHGCRLHCCKSRVFDSRVTQPHDVAVQ